MWDWFKFKKNHRNFHKFTDFHKTMSLKFMCIRELNAWTFNIVRGNLWVLWCDHWDKNKCNKNLVCGENKMLINEWISSFAKINSRKVSWIKIYTNLKCKMWLQPRDFNFTSFFHLNQRRELMIFRPSLESNRSLQDWKERSQNQKKRLWNHQKT